LKTLTLPVHVFGRHAFISSCGYARVIPDIVLWTLHCRGADHNTLEEALAEFRLRQQQAYAARHNMSQHSNKAHQRSTGQKRQLHTAAPGNQLKDVVDMQEGAQRWHWIIFAHVIVLLLACMSRLSGSVWMFTEGKILHTFLIRLMQQAGSRRADAE
jgi:hypothetical protein